MQISQDNNLQAVEVNDQSSGDFHGSFFLDLATHDSLKKLFEVYLVFLIIHFIGSFIAPPNFACSSKIYQIVFDPTIKYVEIDVTLSNLQPKNRLITTYGEVLRKRALNNESIELEITSRTMFNYKFSNVNLSDPIELKDTVYFNENEKSSSPFLIFNKSVDNYDLAQTRLNIHTDFQNIEAFNFSWMSINPNSERFLSYGKLSSLFFSIYILIFFIPLRRFKIEAVTQKFIAILLILSIFASIPITLLFYNNYAFIFECISSAIFVSAFQLFCITQIIITKNNDSLNQRKFFTFTTILFLLTSLLSGLSHFFRFLEIEKPYYFQFSILNIEYINSLVSLVLSICFAVYGLSAFQNRSNQNSSRISISSSFLILSSCFTIFTDTIALLFKWKIKYIWPEMTFLLFHLVSVVYLAFLFHPADNLQYEDIDNNEHANINSIPPGGSVDLFDDDD